MENFFLVWRIIGLLGLILRSTLDETPVFKKMKEHHQLNTKPIEMLLDIKKPLALELHLGL